MTNEPIDSANKNANAPAAPPDKMATPAFAQPEQGKAKRTLGNKIFDWGVYTSIAWVGVSLLSLFTAHEAIHGTNKRFDWLRKVNRKVENATENVLKSTIMKDATPEKLAGWSENISLFAMLAAGGTILMGPIKYLEDNRKKISGKIDQMLGTTPEHCDNVKEEPKQTWGSVLSGRAASVAVALGTLLAIGPERGGKLSKWFGGHFTDMWMKLRPASDAVKVRRWANIAVFDAIFTSVTAAVTYTFSRFVAGKKQKEKPLEDIIEEIDPATPKFDFGQSEPAQKQEKSFAEQVRKAPRADISSQESFASNILKQQEQPAVAALA